jgi:hypothetical protein
MGDKSDDTPSERFEVVVHHVNMEALKVGDVTRNVDRKDLAFADIRGFRTNAEPLDHQATLAGTISFQHDRLVRGELPDVNREGS